ncbi:hypothetical protein ACQE98_09640 [Ornithinimicrobium sp. W1679]|uniref:hypothetical protein n=1 Tax=Ornithinimicrobium sp. W1679 TaxID=3418770 RepID=UPI003CEF0F35
MTDNSHDRDRKGTYTTKVVGLARQLPSTPLEIWLGDQNVAGVITDATGAFSLEQLAFSGSTRTIVVKTTSGQSIGKANLQKNKIQHSVQCSTTGDDRKAGHSQRASQIGIKQRNLEAERFRTRRAKARAAVKRISGLTTAFETPRTPEERQTEQSRRLEQSAAHLDAETARNRVRAFLDRNSQTPPKLRAPSLGEYRVTTKADQQERADLANKATDDFEVGGETPTSRQPNVRRRRD